MSREELKSSSFAGFGFTGDAIFEIHRSAAKKGERSSRSRGEISDREMAQK